MTAKVKPLNKRIPPTAIFSNSLREFNKKNRKADNKEYAYEHQLAEKNLIDQDFEYFPLIKLIDQVLNTKFEVRTSDYLQHLLVLADKYSKSFSYFNIWGQEEWEYEAAKEHHKICSFLSKEIECCNPAVSLDGKVVTRDETIPAKPPKYTNRIKAIAYNCRIEAGTAKVLTRIEMQTMGGKNLEIAFDSIKDDSSTKTKKKKNITTKDLGKVIDFLKDDDKARRIAIAKLKELEKS